MALTLTLRSFLTLMGVRSSEVAMILYPSAPRGEGVDEVCADCAQQSLGLRHEVREAVFEGIDGIEPAGFHLDNRPACAVEVSYRGDGGYAEAAGMLELHVVAVIEDLAQMSDSVDADSLVASRSGLDLPDDCGGSLRLLFGRWGVVEEFILHDSLENHTVKLRFVIAAPSGEDCSGEERGAEMSETEMGHYSGRVNLIGSDTD